MGRSTCLTKGGPTVDKDGTGRVIKKYGPVTSLRRGNVKPELGAGPSRFYTWDNTGGTANGLAEWYLMTHL